ncbi:hypothetical protein B0H12DRAFT_1321035 [Mycena haematopus]|nr:hypothetical protein B0H12DRAFT_1321035 [Mycena haematopus]
MTRKTVILTPEERAICRVRYRQVATYMDPGPRPFTPNDRICQAIAAHWKNGEDLEHGSEYSDLLFPFGNPRAVNRHIHKGSAKTVDTDREVALEWVKTQQKNVRPEILALLGLTDTDENGEDEANSKVEIKNEADVKQEAIAEGGAKRKLDEVDKSEEDTKDGVFSKRPRADATPSAVKTEAEDVRLKTEDKTETEDLRLKTEDNAETADVRLKTEV